MALIVLRLLLPVLLLDVRGCVIAKREKRTLLMTYIPKTRDPSYSSRFNKENFKRGEKKEREIQHVKPQRAATVRTKRNCLIVWAWRSGLRWKSVWNQSITMLRSLLLFIVFFSFAPSLSLSLAAFYSYSSLCKSDDNIPEFIFRIRTPYTCISHTFVHKHSVDDTKTYDENSEMHKTT